MGAGSGGVAAVYPVTAASQTVTIPTPTDPSLVKEVLLYNYSPYLTQVKVGTANAWLAAWMVDKFTVNNDATIQCTTEQLVGNAAVGSSGSITAAWILEGDDVADVGTYPAPLFHLSQFLNIVYPDGQTAIALGPGPSINFYDDNTPQDLTASLTPMVWTMGMAGMPQNVMQMNGGITSNEFPVNNPAAPEKSPAALSAGTFTSGGKTFVGLTLAGTVLNSNLSAMDLYFLSGSSDGTSPGKAAFSYAPDDATFKDLVSINPTFIGFDKTVPCVVINEVWNNLALQNGFTTAVQSGWNTGIRYRLMPDGDVHFDGLVLAPTSPANKVIGTFPVGYRPTKNQVHWAIAAASSPKLTDVLTAVDGTLTYLGDIANPSVTGNVYLTGRFSTL